MSTHADAAPVTSPAALDDAVCARALEARDPRFDGVFFVGIRTTMIYCRPICPSRLSRPERRRYFDSPAAAERHGYRPCLRCRPELAPGRAIVDAVSRVARTAARRIAAGALNGRTVGDLAGELGVGERQLRRAMEAELGVSPLELAQTHRLLLAKSLLTDTRLPVTQVAFASGFQSLRRFNAVFLERYRMPPSALRRQRPRALDPASAARSVPDGTVRLRLPYRAPLAWESLLQVLAAGACPGVEVVEGTRYGRTVALEGSRGAVFVADSGTRPGGRHSRTHPRSAHLAVDVSVGLLPVLMPLMARLRHLFDTDAEPGVIDAHLARGGLGALVTRCPGLRVPGGFDGFEEATRVLLRRSAAEGDPLAGVVSALGEPIEAGHPALRLSWPTPDRMARWGGPLLRSLGVPEPHITAIVALAAAVARGAVRLEPGSDLEGTIEALTAVAALDRPTAAVIAMRALHWPDAFPEPGAAMRRAAGVSNPIALFRLAEQWRPWRSYAAAHLALETDLSGWPREAVPA